ncbi:GFA family protein [Chenggangzhangella methanolivorans]|uniref:GFA family protein n=1 Tax=Chenggangzhangella methanolivorans TaxID=1437009 RepID=A0A9E6RDH1_9HYPH|nr:GFA family protein [Chenggangzhangella methanolivorans]QZO01860.1 GFA family protein [Chenggangzhangella methanolivorans]
MKQTHDGGCACGAVRIRVHGAPIVVHCCHCTICQRLGGSAFATNALIEADRLEVIRGEAVETRAPAGSTPDARPVFRCEACGSALWSHRPSFGERLRIFRVGVMDEPDLFSPDIHIFTAHKAAWVAIPDGLPWFETAYDPADVLTDEQRARIEAAQAD